MYPTADTSYLNVHNAAVAEEMRRDLHRGDGQERGSPHGLRARLARLLVLSGARLIEDTPALVGDRVLILDPPKPPLCCEEEGLVTAA